MKFSSPLVPGRLLRRYQRFLADVEVDGRIVTAHCPNSGSMKTCLEPGGEVWLSRSDNPKRRLAYTWELARLGGAMVFLHPAASNQLVAEAITASRIPALSGYASLRREVAYGEGSRVDLLLEDPARGTCFVEVKHATLSLGAGRLGFPDAVTTRGTKHLRELVAERRRGHRAVLLFTAGRTDARSVQPADEFDPEYGRTLREAVAAGVEVMAWRCSISPREVRLTKELPVLLPEPPRSAAPSASRRASVKRAR